MRQFPKMHWYHRLFVVWLSACWLASMVCWCSFLLVIAENIPHIKFIEMGNLCADDMYKQVKEKYPQEFQQFVEMTEIQKQVEAKSKEL